ncbi:beta-lactamase-like protein [Tricharina praecox]|uniref:beta-lactamase-like protein n=1 Tax=Tricharina praecox TaxID=43433 RepID=UPI00221F20EC|nr:beta-lactamase-like protein [Tricharina praecox]KAI5849226.1 beta-lactamase-like protein [Tricharina praecox]
MKVHATVLSVPSSDTPGTNIVVHFDDRRYLFGHIAEGSQRAYVERRVRLAKVQDIFLTGRTEWATTGGLVGFLLTIGDARKADGQRAEGNPVTIHGGENLLHSIAATRSFVFRGQLKVRVDELTEAPEPKVFTDNNITVKTLQVRPRGGVEESANRKRMTEDMDEQERIKFLKEVVENMFASQKSVNKDRNELEEVDPLVVGGNGSERSEKRRKSEDEENPGGIARYVQSLPPSTPSAVALSYIVVLHDHRGKFLPHIAKQLGVTPGPMFGKLSNGQSVTTRDGRVVQPEEVQEPSIAGTGIAICELPTEEYVEDFVANREWSDVEAVQKKLGAFFWILGSGVAHNAQLVEFMQRFPGSKHIIASPDVCPDPINFKGAAKFTTRLNMIDPVFFPPLHSNSTAEVAPPKEAIGAEVGMVFNIKPEWSLDTTQIPPPFSPEEAFLPEEGGKEFIAIATETREDLAQSPPEKEDFPGSDVEVYTLGTGSALPSRYRNVSATLITIPNNCSILLDCGENTIGQMKRVLTVEDYKHRLLDIKVLYISHLHADHHLGSISFLNEQRQLLRSTGDGSRPTFIVAPQRFWTWLTDYAQIEDIGIDHLVFVPNEHLRSVYDAPATYGALLSALKLEKWETAPAWHCQSSFTTAVTFSSGFKLAYSGDTRPTRSFVEIGQGATLLVHEATFDDELLEEAMAKKHSTIGEAIKSGREMGARKTALVHFSQRYPKSPTFGAGDTGDVVYGFDYMRFKVGEVNRFKRLVKGLAEVYKGEEKEEE